MQMLEASGCWRLEGGLRMPRGSVHLSRQASEFEYKTFQFQFYWQVPGVGRIEWISYINRSSSISQYGADVDGQTITAENSSQSTSLALYTLCPQDSSAQPAGARQSPGKILSGSLPTPGTNMSSELLPPLLSQLVQFPSQGSNSLLQGPGRTTMGKRVQRELDTPAGAGGGKGGVQLVGREWGRGGLSSGSALAKPGLAKPGEAQEGPSSLLCSFGVSGCT
uniref:Uncharacterized protein n=1 Tax=Apteryx owenii TaxID=8824 RepID=A0A8B9PXY1_APTOW